MFNAANLTDGLDGLNTGVAIPVVVVLGVFAYLSGNIIYADYLNIMYIPGSGEILIFAAAISIVNVIVAFAVKREDAFPPGNEEVKPE